MSTLMDTTSQKAHSPASQVQLSTQQVSATFGGATSSNLLDTLGEVAVYVDACRQSELADQNSTGGKGSTFAASASSPMSANLPGAGSQRRWHRYHMQRLQTTANHVLFYLVDAQNNASLAIVGTDVRLSGHFVYCTLPGSMEGPAIRCTNRVKVMEWLAARGATDAADPDRVRVPSISRQQLEMLLTSDPMFSKPQLDREYTSWREEGGRLPDGRHYKNFLLVEDATGAERLVITAEDSHRRDRRYNYKAVPDMGGFAFENGQAVKEWLDFVVGKLVPAAHPPRPLPPKAAARAAAASVAVGGIGQAMSPASSFTMQQAMHQQPLSTFMAAAPTVHDPLPAPNMPSARTNLALPLASALQPAMVHNGLFGQEGVVLAPQRAASAITEREVQHHDAGTHIGPVSAHVLSSPHSMDGSKGGIFYSWNDIDVNAVSRQKAEDMDVDMEPAQQHRSLPPGAANLHSMGSGGGGAKAAAVAGLTGPDVVQAFAHNEELLRWVTGVPDERMLAAFDQWSARLRAIAAAAAADAQILGAMAGGSAALYSKVLATEALQILREMQSQPMCLRLLESSQVSVPVAALRSHPDSELSSLAAHVTQTWRRDAAAALEHATSIMQHSAAGARAAGQVAASSQPQRAMSSQVSLDLRPAGSLPNVMVVQVQSVVAPPVPLSSMTLHQ